MENHNGHDHFWRGGGSCHSHYVAINGKNGSVIGDGFLSKRPPFLFQAQRDNSVGVLSCVYNP
jgi:hypothetical protein